MSEDKVETTPRKKSALFATEVVDLGLVSMTGIFAALVLFQRQGWYQVENAMWILMLAFCCFLLWFKYWTRRHEARVFRWYFMGVATLFSIVTIVLAILFLLQQVG